MVHNGIINVFLKNKGSDSSGFFEDFNKAFIKMLNLKVKRETAIVKCLKILLDGIEGSYSIALFDKDTKIMYYFKNDGTNINFYRFDNNLYITTSIENGKVLKDTYLGKVKEVEIKDFMIYKIFIKNKKVMIYELSKIVKPVFKEKKFDRCYLNPWVDDMRDEEVRETFSNYCTKFNNRIKYLEEETQSRLSEDEKFYLKAYRRGDY